MPGSPESAVDNDVHGGLRSRSYLALLVTQFLVALNDNMLRWLVVPIGKDLVGEGNQALVLSAGLACFVIPYLVLAAPAGYLADRFSKRTVIIGCKLSEIGIMVLAVASILSGDIFFMFVVVTLMGAQSTLFSPAKLGSIPEIVRTDRLSAANGLFGLTTVLAIMIGFVAGNWLYALTTLPDTATPPGQYRWWISAAALLGVATVGWVVSLWIGPLRSADPARRFPLNPAGETLKALAALASRRRLLVAGLGSALFWWLGALAQLNIDRFGQWELFVEQQHVGPLLAVLAAGVGLGSVLAGIWSAGRIELGMVPVGAAGIAASAILLSTVPEGSQAAGSPSSAAYYWTCFWLLAMGASGGLYEIPLQAFLQHESPREARGSIMAAYNFLVFSGMLAMSGLFWVLGDKLQLSARTIFLLIGLSLLPVVCCMVWKMPRQTLRFTLWIISRMIYRVRVDGLENVPETGGALLAPNHVSYVDGPLLGLSSPRHIRFLVFADYFQSPWIRWFGHPKIADVIKVKPGKRSVIESIRAVRESLRNGEVVCIFPEGQVTRTGEMQQFHAGFLAAVKGTGAPVIPVHLGGLWGSIFSFQGGRVFWKRPKRWLYPVTIRFGRPIYHPQDAEQVREAVVELGGRSDAAAN